MIFQRLGRDERTQLRAAQAPSRQLNWLINSLNGGANLTTNDANRYMLNSYSRGENPHTTSDANYVF